MTTSVSNDARMKCLGGAESGSHEPRRRDSVSG
jgi:hypothetical protein